MCREGEELPALLTAAASGAVEVRPIPARRMGCWMPRVLVMGVTIDMMNNDVFTSLNLLKKDGGLLILRDSVWGKCGTVSAWSRVPAILLCYRRGRTSPQTDKL